MAPVGGSDEKTGNGIDAIFHTFAPQKDPIERQRHILGQSCFRVRMDVNKVKGPMESSPSADLPYRNLKAAPKLLQIVEITKQEAEV
jgi:hypothetical protein